MAERGTHDWIDRKSLVDRAKRVEGQAAAVRRMVEDGRPCGEILQQVAALNSAAQRLAVLLLEDHIGARCSERVAGAAVAKESGDLIRRVLKI